MYLGRRKGEKERIEEKIPYKGTRDYSAALDIASRSLLCPFFADKSWEGERSKSQGCHGLENRNGPLSTEKQPKSK